MWNKSRLKRITLQPGPNLGLTELQNANKADCHMRFLKCCLIMKLVSETDLINALHCGTWMFNWETGNFLWVVWKENGDK